MDSDSQQDVEDEDVEVLLPSTGLEPDDTWFETDDPAGWQPRDTDPDWWSADADPLDLTERDRRSVGRARWVFLGLLVFAIGAFWLTANHETEYPVTATTIASCRQSSDGTMVARVSIEGDGPLSLRGIEFVDESDGSTIEVVEFAPDLGDGVHAIQSEATAPAEFSCQLT